MTKPVALHTKHYSRSDEAALLDRDVKVPFTDVQPPDFLTTKKQVDEFEGLARKLKACGIFTELDETVLGQYIIAREVYVDTMRESRRVINDKLAEERDKSSAQARLSKSIKDCRDLASDLGLSITSRCKIQMPKNAEVEEDALNL